MKNTQLIELIIQINQKKQEFATLNPSQLAQKEEFWQLIQAAYSPNPDFVNLENGFYGALPTATMEAQIQHIREINSLTSFYMRRQQPTDFQEIKNKLAELIGCLPEEVALARNSTEASNVLLMGLDLQAGDEILASHQDYPAVLEAIEQRVRRFGIRKKIIELPFHPKNPAEIVDAYAEAISPQTKLIVITHLIHWTGQIVPVKEICAMAHERGIEVLVDSAHGFAQIDFNIRDFDCDYWVANLHKWLAAPLTGGVLAVKKEKIHKIWPLLGDTTFPVDDIHKLEHFSALPMPIYLTVLDAIELHKAIGVENKQARLNYLKNYWTKQVKDIPNVLINTPLENSCAIANFSIAGKTGTETSKDLWEKYRIFSAGFETSFLSGVRITPQFYNTLADLDKLVLAIKELAKS